MTVDLKINMQAMQAHEANQKCYNSPLGTSSKTLLMLLCDILSGLKSLTIIYVAQNCFLH